jgi:hypothetical protein
LAQTASPNIKLFKKKVDLQDIETFLNEITIMPIWDVVLFWVKILAGIYSTLCIFGMVFVIIKRGTLARVIAQTQEVVKDLQYDQQPETVFEKRWASIRELLKSENFSDYRAAIIDADNLLDEALSQLGYKGGNLGDRLKRLDTSKLSNIESLWQARKLRNTFVHNPEYQPKRMDIEGAIDIYEQSLRELGFLNF